MKLQSAPSAALFAIIATLSVGAQAADAPAAADVKADQGAKAVKPHSHVQEKSGMQQEAPAAAATGKKDASKDKSKHYHPRDK